MFRRFAQALPQAGVPTRSGLPANPSKSPQVRHPRAGNCSARPTGRPPLAKRTPGAQHIGSSTAKRNCSAAAANKPVHCPHPSMRAAAHLFAAPAKSFSQPEYISACRIVPHSNATAAPLARIKTLSSTNRADSLCAQPEGSRPVGRGTTPRGQKACRIRIVGEIGLDQKPPTRAIIGEIANCSKGVFRFVAK